MNFDIQNLKHYRLLAVCFILTVFVAMFAQQSRDWILPILFLLLPFVDFQWRMPQILIRKQLLIRWVILVVAISLLLFLNQKLVDTFVVMVLVAALPEEWFFRAYLQKQLGNGVIAVLLVSLMFSFMHFITHNSVAGWLVFVPSVFFGWVYKKTGDLILVVILHALSNLIYMIYFQDIHQWYI